MATAQQDSVHQRDRRSHATRAKIFLTHGHIERIVAAYRYFADQPGLARVASLDEIRAKDGNLSIPLYVAAANVVEQNQSAYAVEGPGGVERALVDWLDSSRKVREALAGILEQGSPKPWGKR